MDNPKIRLNCRPLSQAVWVWFAGLFLFVGMFVVSSNALAAFAVFLAFHWVGCYLLAQAARQLGANPWLYGLTPAIMFPLFPSFSRKLWWRAWASA
jgi:hypothetical protein